MTVRPHSKVEPADRLRVLKGRRSRRRPSLAPWLIMATVVVVAFLGLGFARTTLDKSAFELRELNRAIDNQSALNQELRLEIARLENPARIAPLADDLGLVLPVDTRQLLVDLQRPEPLVAQTSDDGASQ